ncbi:MAG TPA: hypothetical protein VI382_01525 [Candidatus Manganitrophaceae bacterium]|nr:hypothetical protein [Candidatus Manganitrophaceae bacterium]
MRANFFPFAAILALSFLAGAAPGGNNPDAGKEETITGVMRFLNVEGGCWTFKGDNGVSYQPMEGPSILYQDGVRARLTGHPVALFGVCMTGTPFKVLRAEIIRDPSGEDKTQEEK